MVWKVLAPAKSRDLFAERTLPDVSPIFYRVRSESLWGTVLRRAGWHDAGQALQSRFELEGAGGSGREMRRESPDPS